MKLAVIVAAATVVCAATPAVSQTRVQVSVGVVAPPIRARLLIGPRYRVLPPPRVIYGTPRYHGRYHRGRVVVIVPRRFVHHGAHRHPRYHRIRD